MVWPDCSEKKNAFPSASSRRNPSTYHIAEAGPGRGVSRRSPGFLPRGFGTFEEVWSAIRSMRQLYAVGDPVGDGPLGRDRLFGPGEFELAAWGIDADDVPLVEFSLEHPHRQGVEHPALDRPLQRPRPVHRVIALGDQEILGPIAELHADLPTLEPPHQVLQLDIDDQPHLLTAE